MASIKETHIERLNGSDNFKTWQFAIQSLLEYHDLEKCIIPSSTNEAIAEEKDPDKLKKAKARITLSIDKHLYVHVQNCKTIHHGGRELRCENYLRQH